MELKTEDGLPGDLDIAVWYVTPLHRPFNHFTTQFNATAKTWKYIPRKSFFFLLFHLFSTIPTNLTLKRNPTYFY